MDLSFFWRRAARTFVLAPFAVFSVLVYLTLSPPSFFPRRPQPSHVCVQPDSKTAAAAKTLFCESVHMLPLVWKGNGNKLRSYVIMTAPPAARGKKGDCQKCERAHTFHISLCVCCSSLLLPSGSSSSSCPEPINRANIHLRDLRVLCRRRQWEFHSKGTQRQSS